MGQLTVWVVVTLKETDFLLLLITGCVVLMLSKLPENSAPNSLNDTLMLGEGKAIISFVASCNPYEPVAVTTKYQFFSLYGKPFCVIKCTLLSSYFGCITERVCLSGNI